MPHNCIIRLDDVLFRPSRPLCQSGSRLFCCKLHGRRVTTPTQTPPGGVRNKEEDLFDITKFRTVLLLSVATSIDALAVGFGFAMMQETRIGRAVAHIGVVSFLMSLLGYGLTSRWSTRVKANVAEIIGGVVLILIGLKILLVK